VPAILRMLLDHEDAATADLSAIESLCTVGSAMPLPLEQRLVARFPHAFCEIYGLTEGLILFLAPRDAAAHIESVGKPMIGYDIRIVGDDDRELPAGQKGEIVGYGPMLMKGYNRRPDATGEAIWREPVSGRTLRSGDIGRFDADGFLHLVDRKKDMLVSGGYNVFPADIERVAVQHAAVLEVAVVGVPHGGDAARRRSPSSSPAPVPGPSTRPPCVTGSTPVSASTSGWPTCSWWTRCRAMPAARC